MRPKRITALNSVEETGFQQLAPSMPYISRERAVAKQPVAGKNRELTLSRRREDRMDGGAAMSEFDPKWTAPRKIISVVDHESELLDHRLPFAFFALDILHVFRWRTGDWIAAGIK